jgi:hypothetical protein
MRKKRTDNRVKIATACALIAIVCFTVLKASLNKKDRHKSSLRILNGKNALLEFPSISAVR